MSFAVCRRKVGGCNNSTPLELENDDQLFRFFGRFREKKDGYRYRSICFLIDMNDDPTAASAPLLRRSLSDNNNTTKSTSSTSTHSLHDVVCDFEWKKK